MTLDSVSINTIPLIVTQETLFFLPFFFFFCVCVCVKSSELPDAYAGMWRWISIIVIIFNTALCPIALNSSRIERIAKTWHL